MQAYKDTDYKDVIANLRLARSQNVGPQTFKKLISLYDSAHNALLKLPELSANGGAVKKIKICDESTAEREFERIKNYNAELIFYSDCKYPKLLQQTPDSPPVITVLGNISLLNNINKVAVVGARNASTNGLTITRELVQKFADENIVTVSGLAAGIDTCVHMHSHKSTIAVMASGIDVCYPLQNKPLYKSITNDGGLIITEYPFGSSPFAQNFPQRNRIIAGLSRAVIIIEASVKSGSLITANYALKYVRKVFVVPGSILDDRYAGSNSLIKNKEGILLNNFDDITEFLMTNECVLNDNHSLIVHANNPKISDQDLKKWRSIFQNSLSYDPTSISDIIITTGIPYGMLNILILEMEIAGKIERCYANKLVRIK